MGMLDFVKFHTFLSKSHFKKPRTVIPFISISRSCYFCTSPLLDSGQRVARSNVALLWDINCKQPKTVSPSEAAVKLKKAAAAFGIVQYMVAYGDASVLNSVSPEIKKKRKDYWYRRELMKLGRNGGVEKVEPCVCRFCGRRFYDNERLVNHFRQTHEREIKKKMNQIESARGSRRVKLVGKYSMKIEKYKNAAEDIFSPNVGLRLGDELKKAGFLVWSEKSQAMDFVLKNHVEELMGDRFRVECVFLVSDDSKFVEAVTEVKSKCLKTVVVGDVNGGALKRVADAAFSWNEVMIGKVKNQAVKVVGQWKDHDVLTKLEWTYDPEKERKIDGSRCVDGKSEDSDLEGFFSGEDDEGNKEDKNIVPWWKLDADATPSK